MVGLRGHILNLDYPVALNDWQRTDLKELIWAEPQKVVTAGKIAAALKTLGARRTKWSSPRTSTARGN